MAMEKVTSRFGPSPHQHVYEKRGCYGESEPLCMLIRTSVDQ